MEINYTGYTMDPASTTHPSKATMAGLSTPSDVGSKVYEDDENESNTGIHAPPNTPIDVYEDDNDESDPNAGIHEPPSTPLDMYEHDNDENVQPHEVVHARDRPFKQLRAEATSSDSRKSLHSLSSNQFPGFFTDKSVGGNPEPQHCPTMDNDDYGCETQDTVPMVDKDTQPAPCGMHWDIARRLFYGADGLRNYEERGYERQQDTIWDDSPDTLAQLGPQKAPQVHPTRLFGGQPMRGNSKFALSDQPAPGQLPLHMSGFPDPPLEHLFSVQHFFRNRLPESESGKPTPLATIRGVVQLNELNQRKTVQVDQLPQDTRNGPSKATMNK
jgi:hypothetical protein